MPTVQPKPEDYVSTDDPAVERLLATMLMQGLDATHVGICLCDERDEVRFVNEAFRHAFFPDITTFAGDFAAALAGAITTGRGVQLTSMPLATFISRVREQRLSRQTPHDFSVDLVDGRWWRICDHKLPNGWMLTVATDVSTLKQEEIALRHAHASAVEASRTDHLTGLPNRRCGIEATETALAVWRNGQGPLSVAFLDIDRFKRINDTHGHAAGDAVLVSFAEVLRRVASDMLGASVSRMGGEEFLVVMPEMGHAEAGRALALLIRTLTPVIWNPELPMLCYSVSVGVADARLGDGVNELLGRADAALYRAKTNGRARVEVS